MSTKTPALSKKEVRTEGAPPLKLFYSQGVVVRNMVFASGGIGVDPVTLKLVEVTIGDRTACSASFHWRDEVFNPNKHVE